MYVLQFLKEAADAEGTGDGRRVTVEYRLACSGELFNARVQTCGSWRKSDVTRLIGIEPVEIFVVSHPFDAYPQELCLRLTTEYVTEESVAENSSFRSIFLPDEEIVEDLCSLLSLLARRLIVPVAKTREQHVEGSIGLGSFGQDLPLPILERRQYETWRRRPDMVITRGPHEQEILSYHPPPVGVLPDVLRDLLSRFHSLPEAARIIRAARLYREALELIETRSDSAYQLLISVAETLSKASPPALEPTEEEILESRATIRDMALEFGLNPDQAKKIALAAGKGNPWTKRKFKAFLSRQIVPEELARKDRVFHPLTHLCPSADEFSKTLGNIYELRSGNLHDATPFPRASRIGTSPLISRRDLPLDPRVPQTIPPVVWFERVVSLAARRFILDYSSTRQSPFADPDLSTAPE